MPGTGRRVTVHIMYGWRGLMIRFAKGADRQQSFLSRLLRYTPPVGSPGSDPRERLARNHVFSRFLGVFTAVCAVRAVVAGRDGTRVGWIVLAIATGLGAAWFFYDTHGASRRNNDL